MKMKSCICGLMALVGMLLTAAPSALAKNVTLAWDRATEAKVVGYKVYYRANSSSLPFNGVGAVQGSSPVNVGSGVTVTLSGLDDSQTHYFAITAYDAAGNESGFSNIVSSGPIVVSPPPAPAPTLSSLTISGPASLSEGGVATFVATAAFSDGSSSPATPTWSENSAYATIDASGVLTASAVTANQTVAVAASYTSGGVTKTASKSVTIIDVPATPAPEPAPAPTPDLPSTTGDTDGDGMPDSFEVANGFDYSNPGDAQLDADGDNLSNLAECQCGTNPRNPDTDGDGVWDGSDQAPLDSHRPMISTLGRQLYGFWYLDNGNFSWNQGVDAAFTGFGAPFDIPVTGDWDGDGKSQIGTYRQGQWFLDNGNGQWDAGADTAFANFGAAGDIPVTGDWNGNGKTKVGTYRRGAWYLDNGNGQWDGPGIDTVIANFGAADDTPVTGDWSGDGKTQVGTFRQGTWFLDNGNGQWDAGVDKVCHFGMAGDIPVTGDWNGDGKTQIAVYRQGTLYIDANGNGAWDPGIDEAHTGFGSAMDTPVSGDWTGDGKSKIGMWR